MELLSAMIGPLVVGVALQAPSTTPSPAPTAYQIGEPLPVRSLPGDERYSIGPSTLDLGRVAVDPSRDPRRGPDAHAAEILRRPPALVPVDQGYQDRGPIGTSLRELEPDMREPFGFQRIYRSPSDDGRLMRADGGVAMLFPMSVYVATKKGMKTVIPPGTVFVIGWQPRYEPTGPTATGEAQRLATRVTQAVGGQIDPTAAGNPSSGEPVRAAVPPQSGTVDPPAPARDLMPTMIADPAYRRARLADLVARATSGE